MIGLMVLAGLIVRNSILLVDLIIGHLASTGLTLVVIAALYFSCFNREGTSNN
jgi:multidrug efflux pump subunit AcrB